MGLLVCLEVGELIGFQTDRGPLRGSRSTRSAGVVVQASGRELSSSSEAALAAFCVWSWSPRLFSSVLTLLAKLPFHYAVGDDGARPE